MAYVKTPSLCHPANLINSDRSIGTSSSGGNNIKGGTLWFNIWLLLTIC